MKQGGFSLIESLVAIAILAMGAVSVLVLMAEQSRTQIFMEQKFASDIIAGNLMVEELIGERRDFLQGNSKGRVERGGVVYYWQRQTSPTDLPNIYEITYEVRRQPQGQILASVTRLRRIP